MHKGRLARASVLLSQDQLDRLRRISEESGVPVAVMVRRGIQRFLDALDTGSVPRPGPGIEGLVLARRDDEADSPPAATPRLRSTLELAGDREHGGAVRDA